MMDSTSSARGGAAGGGVGRERSRRWTSAGFLMVGVSAGAFGWVGAQEPGQAAVAPAAAQPASATPTELRTACAAQPEYGDPFLIEVAKARDAETPEAESAALDALEPEARRMAAESPNDAAVQFRLAAVMGARLDLEHGTSKINGGSELHDQVVRVLELDPGHPGANYIMGKLHASVRRLGGVKRFLATNILGGGALKDASWEEAQQRLELAVREEPCVPEHHFELARVYAEKGPREGWERELAYVIELTEGATGPRKARLHERAVGFQQEWRQKAP